MPFDVGATINSIADKFLQVPFVRGVASNPIYTALLITFAVVLVVMFIFRDADTGDESLTSASLRTGFWVFLLLCGVLMLQNKVLLTESGAAKRLGEYEGVFGGGYGSGLPGSAASPNTGDIIVPININTNFLD